MIATKAKPIVDKQKINKGIKAYYGKYYYLFDWKEKVPVHLANQWQHRSFFTLKIYFVFLFSIWIPLITSREFYCILFAKYSNFLFLKLIHFDQLNILNDETALLPNPFLSCLCSQYLGWLRKEVMMKLYMTRGWTERQIRTPSYSSS